MNDSPRIYLAGAMERAPGQYGEKWRKEIQEYSEDIGYTVWNPYEQESIALTTFGYSHPSEWTSLRYGSVEDQEKHKQIISTIIMYDLLKVRHETELVVCRWDAYSQAGGGTNAELSEAFMDNIRVITWVNCPINEVPSWVLGCMGIKVFNIEDLKQEIKKAFNTIINS